MSVFEGKAAKMAYEQAEGSKAVRTTIRITNDKSDNSNTGLPFSQLPWFYSFSFSLSTGTCGYLWVLAGTCRYWQVLARIPQRERFGMYSYSRTST